MQGNRVQETIFGSPLSGQLMLLEDLMNIVREPHDIDTTVLTVKCNDRRTNLLEF